MELLIHPTFAGAAIAAGAIAVGAPLFGEGLRTFRLRRHLGRLTERPLAEVPTGFIHVRGRVTLESPLFAPLSGRPCAGFRLEVRGSGTATASVVDVRRPFRLTAGGVVARVLPPDGLWNVSVTDQRTVRPDQSLTENLGELLAKSAEAQWLRRRGATLVLTERALFAGAEGHVVGVARQSRPFELPVETELLRTGTDDVVEWASAAAAGPEPDLWIDAGGHLDFLHIADHSPGATEITAGPLRLLGLFLGPALSLGGLLYLARAADVLRSSGRF